MKTILKLANIKQNKQTKQGQIQASPKQRNRGVGVVIPLPLLLQYFFEEVLSILWKLDQKAYKSL